MAVDRVDDLAPVDEDVVDLDRPARRPRRRQRRPLLPLSGPSVLA
jgi:hypothetical protein